MIGLWIGLTVAVHLTGQQLCYRMMKRTWLHTFGKIKRSDRAFFRALSFVPVANFAFAVLCWSTSRQGADDVVESRK